MYIYIYIYIYTHIERPIHVGGFPHIYSAAERMAIMPPPMEVSKEYVAI